MPQQLKPIRYSQWQRWADVYHGWRDGRGQIPQPPLAPGPVTTPHREALIRLAQDAFAREHLEYRKVVAEPHRKIMAARAKREMARLTLKLANDEFALVPTNLTDAESGRRRLGESRHPESVIIRRRRKEHRELRSRAYTAVTSAQREVTTIEGDLESASQEAKQHHDAAAIRVERIHEYIHRRLSVYRRTLIRFHPDGAWVNTAMSVRTPSIPGWALPDAYPPEKVTAPPPPLIEEPVLNTTDVPLEPPGIVDLLHDETRFGAVGGTASGGHGFVEVESPVVAVWHFTVVKVGEDLELRTRGYGHGPFIGGEPVGTARIKSGGYFDFAGYRYTVLDKDHLLREPLGEPSIVAADLFAKSGPKPRLSGMSFVQHERTLLAVLGPSGAGKSSLCFALLDELPLESGRLFFGRMPMTTHSKQIRDRLGFVPQDINLHMTLTVEDTLRYGYSLRSSDKAQRERRIDRAIDDTSLKDQRNQLLSTLSGGQLRRVSIALELLSKPPLLMLDEPTSGLDASMDRQIMTILRDYALAGHTVVVVTHNTEHLRLANQIVVVVEGGTPAYSGLPRGLRKFFGVTNYADLMSLLLNAEQRKDFVDQYRAGDRAKEARHEAERLQKEIAAGSPAGTPAGSPAGTPAGTPAGSPTGSSAGLPVGSLAASPVISSSPQKAAGKARRDARRQFRVLIVRQARLLRSRALKGNDRSPWQSLVNGLISSLPLLIAVLSAALAALVAGPPGLGAGTRPSDVGPTSLALLTTLCVLSGQALTYSDVVNEIEIVRREFRAGVGVLPILGAKWVVYAAMAIAQAGLISFVFCVIPHRAPQRSVLLGPDLDLFAGLAALSIAAMTLGLLISTVFRKLEHAIALVTATSIAQIALNGVTSDLSKPSVTSWLAALLPDRWGLAASASSVDLRGIERGNPTLAGHDALWAHSAAQWATDVGALAALSAVFFVLAAWRLKSGLRPRGLWKRLLARLLRRDASGAGQVARPAPAGSY